MEHEENPDPDSPIPLAPWVIERLGRLDTADRPQLEGRQKGLWAKLWWGNMNTVEQNQHIATCGTASTSAFQVICNYFP